MRINTLGKTGIKVSALGLGTVKFGRNQGVKYPEPFDLPDEQALQNLLGCAKDLGVNFLDTAPAYGHSEERLGRLLQGMRHEWVIATKVGESFMDGESFFDFSPQAIRKSVERSLQRLKTDYLDLVLVHSDGSDLLIMQEDKPFAELAKLKQEGKIRAFGMSTKTIEGGLLACEQSDVVMVTYRPDYQLEAPVIASAHAHERGVLIKKALSSGHLAHSVEDVMQFVFSQPGVSSVIVGTLNLDHLRANVAAIPSSRVHD